MDTPTLSRKFENSTLYIEESVQGFVTGLTQAFSSILGVQVTLDQDKLVDTQKRFDTSYKTIASVPLSGSITGEIFLCINKSSWKKTLADISGTPLTDPSIDELFNSCMQEIINTAGAEASVPIKRAFGLVTMLSPRLIEGKLHYPATKINRVKFRTEDNTRFEGFLSLDLMEQDLRVEHEKLKRDSILDDTGLYNKKHFLDVLEQFKETFKNNGYFSVVFADINRLKHVNDTYGHEAGDAYISAAANIIKQSCRFSDFCFRVGGDELVILLPKCNLEDSTLVIQRINQLISLSQLEFSTESGEAEVIQVHMSIGVCSNSEGIAPSDVLSTADKRMEEDKRKWYETQDFNRRK